MIDLHDAILLPGFVEPHSHPFVSGVATQSPTIWIAPYVGYPTWNDVTALFTKLDAETQDHQPLLLNGVDRLLQAAPCRPRPSWTATFRAGPSWSWTTRGILAYFNSATIAMLGWDRHPPAEPVGGSFGRTADGKLDGCAYEMPAVMQVAGPLMAAVVTHPLHSAAKWYRLMASNGITSTSDMTYDSAYLKGYEALAEVAHCPLPRLAVPRVDLARVRRGAGVDAAGHGAQTGDQVVGRRVPVDRNRRAVVPVPLQRRRRPGTDSDRPGRHIGHEITRRRNSERSLMPTRPKDGRCPSTATATPPSTSSSTSTNVA